MARPPGVHSVSPQGWVCSRGPGDLWTRSARDRPGLLKGEKETPGCPQDLQGVHQGPQGAYGIFGGALISKTLEIARDVWGHSLCKLYRVWGKCRLNGILGVAHCAQNERSLWGCSLCMLCCIWQFKSAFPAEDTTMVGHHASRCWITLHHIIAPRMLNPCEPS